MQVWGYNKSTTATLKETRAAGSASVCGGALGVDDLQTTFSVCFAVTYLSALKSEKKKKNRKNLAPEFSAKREPRMTHKSR